MIFFCKKVCDVPQKEISYSISYLQINSFNSETFRKTTELNQIEINESATTDTPDNFVDTETIISNKKVVSVDQKALATTYTRPEWSNEVTPNHEYLVDCACGLMSAKDCCIANDQVMISVKNEKTIKVISHFNNNRGIITLML